MAVRTLGKLGDAGEAAVFPEEMATFTAFIHLPHMQGVVEAERLLLL
jgi:hypothetical protein